MAVKFTLKHPTKLIKSNGLFKTTSFYASLCSWWQFFRRKEMLPTSNKLLLLFPLKWPKIIVFINLKKNSSEKSGVLSCCWEIFCSLHGSTNSPLPTQRVDLKLYFIFLRKIITYIEWAKYFISRLNRLYGHGHWQSRVLCMEKEGIVIEWVPWESICRNSLCWSVFPWLLLKLNFVVKSLCVERN